MQQKQNERSRDREAISCPKRGAVKQSSLWHHRGWHHVDLNFGFRTQKAVISPHQFCNAAADFLSNAPARAMGTASKASRSAGAQPGPWDHLCCPSFTALCVKEGVPCFSVVSPRRCPKVPTNLSPFTECDADASVPGCDRHALSPGAERSWF